MQPGDLVLCRQNTVLDKIISVSQRLRTSSKASHWTHVAVVKDPKTGELYEAVGRGVRIGNISAYPDHLVIPLNLNANDTAKMMTFCEHWLGAEYGVLTLFSIGLDLLTPAFIHFRSGDTFICSQYAAKAYEQTGWICPMIDTSHTMPSNLAAWLLNETQHNAE
jgi:hypothetical protein